MCCSSRSSFSPATAGFRSTSCCVLSAMQRFQTVPTVNPFLFRTGLASTSTFLYNPLLFMSGRY